MTHAVPPEAKMFVIEHAIEISAPIERCFLLSTSLAIVERELGMHPVAGRDPESGEPTRTSGLVTAGDRIHWKGWQLGLPQFHVSLISAFKPPAFFQDTMVAGRFRSFQHDHSFTPIGDSLQGPTRLDDTIRFSLPFGPLGRLAGRYILAPHIRALLRRRFALLKRIAESEEWRSYIAS